VVGVDPEPAPCALLALHVCRVVAARVADQQRARAQGARGIVRAVAVDALAVEVGPPVVPAGGVGVRDRGVRVGGVTRGDLDLPRSQSDMYALMNNKQLN
jgi:hypothetical protein